MLYLDTSVLVAYYCPEPLSDAVEKEMLKVSNPGISALTEVEFVSAIGRKLREKTLSGEDANRLLNKFQAHLNESLYKRFLIDNKHYRLAFNWLSRLDIPMRTLDALHLAVVAESNLKLVTADKQLSRAARKLGVPFKLIR